MSHYFTSKNLPETLFLSIMLCLLLPSCRDLSYKTRDELFQAEQSIRNDSVEEGIKRLEALKSRYNNGSSLTKYRFVLAYMYAQKLMGHPITNDSILERALHFCEKNASTNAQTKARYLLGCCYQDKEQYSMAQQWFLKAAENADTITHDFDYDILFHTYMQLGDLYRKEHSTAIAEDTYHKAGFYAQKMNDSTKWAESIVGVASCKLQRKEWDECMALCRTAQPYLYRKKTPLAQNPCLNALKLTCISAIETGNLEQARTLLDSMERYPNLVLSAKQIQSIRGSIEDCQVRYLIKSSQLDAAKNLVLHAKQNASKERQTFLMKQAAEIYYATGQKDAAFSLLQTYTERLDSTLSQNLAQEMQQFQHTLNKMDAQQQIERSQEQKRQTIIGCIASILLLVGLFLGLDFRNRQRFRIQLERFTTKNKELKEQRELLERLKETNEMDFKRQIKQLEERLTTKETELSDYLQQIPSKVVAEEMLGHFKQAEVCQNIHYKVRHNERVTDEDLRAVYDILPDYLPQVFQKVSSHHEILQGALFRTLVFTLLQVRGKDIASQCFCEAHAISMNKARINEILFGQHTAKNLLRNLLEAG